MAFDQAGKYDVTVTGSALGESKENKTPQIIIEFEDHEGARICAYLFLSDNAWQYTEEKLRTLGWDPQRNGLRFEELNADPSPIVGHKVQIVLNEDTYNGKRSLKVAYINPPGGGIRERMPAAEAKSFADRLRKRLANYGGPPPQQAPAGQSDGKEPWETDPYPEQRR